MRRFVSGVLVFGILVGVSGHAATVDRKYTWDYGGRTWTLTHAFDLSAYSRYRSLPRLSAFTDYAEYVVNTDDDATIASLAAELLTLAHAAALNEWEALHLIISFVQSFRYVPEETEYPRYPIETLIEGCGDCEDLAILTADILRQLGFDVVLLAFTEEMHMAVGIRAYPPDGRTANAFDWNGDSYYYLETTAAGWTIGQMPAQFTSAPNIIALAPAGS